jgi:mediator of RNA polymerase II transcription subunit 13
VYFDSNRDGIWVFRPSPNSPSKPADEGFDPSSDVNLSNVPGIELSRRDRGTYEPANFARSRILGANSLGTPNTTSSPSAIENMMRNAQSFNARAVQTNSSQAVYDLTASSPGVKSAVSAGDSSSSLREMQEHFIAAVLGSIVYNLCRDYGFVPLNSRTMIAPPDTSLSHDSTITLVTLDISLTSLGTLVIKAYSGNAPGLQRIVKSASKETTSKLLFRGTPLWLAPGGTPAKFYSFAEEDQFSGAQPMSDLQKAPEEHGWRFQGTTIKTWQSRCLEWLSTKGLDSNNLDEGGWIFVQMLKNDYVSVNQEYSDIPLPDDGAIVPWPVLLCFRSVKTSSPELQSSSMSFYGIQDPLSFAEEWFTTEESRANLLSQRLNERKIVEATRKERAEKEAHNQATIHSASLLEKGNNAGAMYPTPPDAIQHPVGVTPSFDGAVSTPGNQPQLFAQDIEANNTTNPLMTTADIDHWGSTEAKHRPTSNMNFGENDNDNDNLFGDMGGDMFGDADITDADFNFFDQPDDIQIDLQPASPSIPPTIPTQQPKKPEKPSIPNKPAVFLPVSQDTEMKDLWLPETSTKTFQNSGDLQKLPREKAVEPRTGNNNSQILPPPRISAPFDKETVYRRLLQNITIPASPRSGKISSFNKVEFRDPLTSIMKKYGSQGSFGYSEDELRRHPVSLHNPTTPMYLDRRMAEKKTPTSDKLARILNGDTEPYDLPLGDEESLELQHDSDSVSDASDSDDALTMGLSMTSLSRKRKGYTEGAPTPSIVSFDVMDIDYEPSAGTPQSVIEPQLPLFESDPADWSLTPYVTSPEPDVPPNGLSDHECIVTAQILADQAASGSLRLPGQQDHTSNDPLEQLTATRRLMSGLSKATEKCFKDVQNCSMRSYLDIQGIPAINPALRLPPRPMPNPRAANPSTPQRPANIFLIQPPQLEVRRGDSKLAVLPPAIQFWDNLGLAPFTGGKDVNAVCIYPGIDGMAENADNFLDQMRGSYESLRFGFHDRLISNDLPNSLLHFPIDGTNQANGMLNLTTLKEIMGRLSRILSTSPVEEKNILVYFIYPIDNSPLLVHICSAFKHLFNLYRKSLMEKKQKATELVLQLVPINFVAAPTSLVVPSPTEYSRLAMEVYDRCVDFTSFSSTSAILLERPLPKSIDFKLSANPSPSLLQENSCLHIAYAQSLDDRWITAAWSDNRGTKQMTASYCLGRKNEPLTIPFSHVANEIWETTLDVISSKKVHWRIVIVKSGVMDQSEIDFWTGLASTESNAQISLTLLTVQTDPSLHIIPPPLKLTPTSATTAQTVITPVSTPQASQSSLFSPDTPSREQPPTTAATPVEAPPSEPDNNSRLVDYTDQTWGAILSHRLNNSNSLLEFNPALISGYLIKNGGTTAEDPPVILEVNIIHAEVAGNPRTFHESLLREILGYYRGLATLARVRGVVDPVRDGRPWHIAAAEKAVKALYTLL